tara:strand:+ start:256 stop:711 length:456 start_codon:yes stop_codon:yes gene_type:complete
MPIKSFRGKIADDGKDTIVLHTNNGSTGYKIIKLQLFPAAPGVNNVENILQIFTVEQTGTASATPDFEDNTLLAAGYYQDNASSAVPSSSTVVFDNTTFNQDIYITQRDISNGTPGDGTPVNYYIELEQIKLDLNENTVATLKDIRNIKSQ